MRLGDEAGAMRPRASMAARGTATGPPGRTHRRAAAPTFCRTRNPGVRSSAPGEPALSFGRRDEFPPGGGCQLRLPDPPPAPPVPRLPRHVANGTGETMAELLSPATS